MQDAGFRVWGLWLRVQSWGFRVQCLGSWVQGLGFEDLGVTQVAEQGVLEVSCQKEEGVHRLLALHLLISRPLSTHLI